MARESLEESPTCVFTRGTEQLAETVRQLSFYLTNVRLTGWARICKSVVAIMTLKMSQFMERTRNSSAS